MEGKENKTLKPADNAGKVFEVVGARMTSGRFGPQVALQVKGGLVAYVSAKSGIAKGLHNGKLRPSVASPMRITAAETYGQNGAFMAWTLAPRNAGA